MAEKQYVGKGKVVGQYGNIAVSICLDDINSHSFEYNGKHYVKVVVAKMQTADKYGKTHTVFIDDFKPDPTKRKDSGSQEQAQQTPSPVNDPDIIDPDDIPF